MNANSKSTANGLGALKADIDRRFPRGRFVAIDGERVIADAGDPRSLAAMLTAMGKDPRLVLAVQAGVQYPESALILIGRGGDE